jgi:hypothetical protein
MESQADLDAGEQKKLLSNDRWQRAAARASPFPAVQNRAAVGRLREAPAATPERIQQGLRSSAASA